MGDVAHKVSPERVWNLHIPLCAPPPAKTQPKEFISHFTAAKISISENTDTAQHEENTKTELQIYSKKLKSREKRLQLELAAVVSHFVH